MNCNDTILFPTAKGSKSSSESNNKGHCRDTCVLSPDPGDEKIAKNLETNLHKPTVTKRAINGAQNPEAERTQTKLVRSKKEERPHKSFQKHCIQPYIVHFIFCVRPHVVTLLRPAYSART